MVRFRRRSVVVALIAAAAAHAIPAALASNAPADPCSLLPASEAARVLAQPFGAPARSVAPRPFMNTAQGTDCFYHAQDGRVSLQFRVYFDPSPSASAELFKRLQAFFGSGTPVAGVGDEAYFDSKHALHARKGNARFYLSFDGTRATAPAKEKMLSSLGTAIAGRI